jgi:hypothetical protein
MLPFWLRFYNSFLIVILPSILNGVFNALIFLRVHSSTRRIQALATTTSAVTAANSNHRQARDIYLLKHTLFIFIVFVGGWAPVYILTVAVFDGTTYYVLYLLSELLPPLGSLIVTLDLFVYNHDLRRYWKGRLLKCLHLNRN